MDISVNQLIKRYGKLSVFDGFDLTLTSGNRHCLFGPSGCGKTTLLNVIAGLEPFDGGQIKGAEGKKIAYVFQEERLLPWLSVKENIAFVLNKDKDKVREQKIDEVLELVELLPFKNHLPSELSGGMRQRVSLARAFAHHAEILILDEPFKGLHLDLKERLMDYVLKYWAMEKPHLIFTTHDVDEALYLSTDVFVMKGPPAKVKAHMNLEGLAKPEIKEDLLKLIKSE